jgi:uncharacterized coiled-coil DUF342 family protein
MNMTLQEHISQTFAAIQPKALPAKRERDRKNAESKKHMEKRNKLNEEVKRLTENVKQHKKQRDKYNADVKAQKKKRKEAVTEYKQVTNELKEAQGSALSNIDLQKLQQKQKNAVETQNRAHERVKELAAAGQEQHDLMLEANKVVKDVRDRSEEAHRSWRAGKKVADELHMNYIVLLRCVDSCKDILRAIEHAQVPQEKPEPNIEVPLIKPQPTTIESPDEAFRNLGL